jgi:chemotaxis protein methyltransferase WspC
MQPIEQLLKERIGLDVSSIGSSLIQRTVRLRMKRLGLQTLSNYEELLLKSESECWELIESVVVTETWFFRDRASLHGMVRLLASESLLSNPAARIRILCIPCSSGEEPYSIVMALTDSGLRHERFEIDAADISERALAKARAGKYGRNSFRGKDLAYRERYFKPGTDGYLLEQSIREKVSFHHANILTRKDSLKLQTYDFVFCRNLLIYFDRETQRVALQRIGELLSPTGILFVGPAELPLVLAHGYAPLPLPMTFACRKGMVTGQRDEDVQFVSGNAVSGLPVSGEPRTIAAQIKPTLEEAQHLANAGSFHDAFTLCERHLKDHGPSAHAYYVLGLVEDARGNLKAALDYYRKTLYLEPGHYEALLQMALISFNNGEHAQARNFKARAQRSRSNRVLELPSRAYAQLPTGALPRIVNAAPTNQSQPNPG